MPREENRLLPSLAFPSAPRDRQQASLISERGRAFPGRLLAAAFANTLRKLIALSHHLRRREHIAHARLSTEHMTPVSLAIRLRCISWLNSPRGRKLWPQEQNAFRYWRQEHGRNIPHHHPKKAACPRDRHSPSTHG